MKLNLREKLSVEGLRNLGGFAKDTAKGILLTNEDNSSLNSYLTRTKSSWEMDQEEVACKLECVRFALESALSPETGDFQNEKFGFIRDMVKSMLPNCTLRRNFKVSLTEKENPYFAVTTDEHGLSDVELAAYREIGKEPAYKNVMIYHFEQKLLMSGKVVPYFRMEVSNQVMMKKVQG